MPKPVGGVTSFVRRLVCSEPHRFSAIVDLYPSPDKEVPHNFSGDYFVFNKVAFFFRLVFSEAWRDRSYFFNFSRAFSLLFFLFWKKGRGDYRLLLHHGDIQTFIPKSILYCALRKFDIIYCLNESQVRFYREIGVDLNLVQVKSYVTPVFMEPAKEVVNLFFNLRSRYRYVYVCSGFPREYYNLEWCVERVSMYPDSCLLVFLYGDGEFRSELTSLDVESVFVFDDCSEDYFNSSLCLSDFYLRPSSKDSFGVAVADAVELGCTVVASDVCERYQGSFLFQSGSKVEFFNLVDSLRSAPIELSNFRQATKSISPFEF